MQNEKLNCFHYNQYVIWEAIILFPLNKLWKIMLLCLFDIFIHSTWTIDLCYLLSRYNIKHIYYTITIGINPNYISKRYYKNVLTRDYERISAKFTAAGQHGLIVERKSIETAELLDHLAKYGPIIALTNANQLQCEICDSSSRNLLR